MRAIIERVLKDTAPRLDPEDLCIPGIMGDIPPALRKLRPANLTPAAVLVCIRERDGEPRVVLTRRTDHLKHHPGQISFPGGRLEPGDTGPVDTALRETHEEIGLEPHRVTVAGFLRNYLTITGYTVTPVVGFVDGPVEYRLDENEVADAFEVPLAFLLDPANHTRQERQFAGMTVPIYEILYRDRRIWGATAGMIVGFHDILKDYL